MLLTEQLRLGWSWYRSGLKIVRSQPLSYTAVVVFYAMTMGLLGMVPAIGTVLAGVFWPFGSIMLADAGRAALEGRKPTLQALGESIRYQPARLRLIRTGILYAIFAVSIMIVWQLLGEDEIAQWQLTEEGRVIWSSASEHIPYGAFIAAVLLYVPAVMATWFAPLLVYVKDMTIGKAVFFSFMGCLTHLTGIVTALILAFGTCFAVMSCALILLGVSGLGSASVYVMLPLALLGSALIYGMYYPMWHSVFSEVSIPGTETQKESGI